MEWRRSPVVGIIAGIVIIVTLVFIVTFVSKKPKYPTRLICEDTGTVFEMRLPVDAKFPITCPDSGKKTAYLAVEYTCENGHKFLKPATPMLLPGAEKTMPGEEVAFLSVEEKAKIGSLIRCPVCGSVNVKGEFSRETE